MQKIIRTVLYALLVTLATIGFVTMAAYTVAGVLMAAYNAYEEVSTKAGETMAILSFIIAIAIVAFAAAGLLLAERDRRLDKEVGDAVEKRYGEQLRAVREKARELISKVRGS